MVCIPTLEHGNEKARNVKAVNYFLNLLKDAKVSILIPDRAANLDCLSSKVRNLSALIDKAEATCRMSNALEPVLLVCFLDKSTAYLNVSVQLICGR